MRPCVLCDGLSVKIKGRKILEDVSFEVFPGEILTILGPSGAGKSTLLRCINRLIDYVEGAEVFGRVEVLGKEVFKIDPSELRRKVGTVFQEPNPLPHLSIFDNVALPIRLTRRIRREELRKEVEKYLKMTMLWEEVKDRLRDPPTVLSGGQQQRLCLARALALNPQILLLDEPTANIDEENSIKIEECIRELAKEGRAVIWVTHYLPQAARVSDRVLIMRKGRIVEEVSPEEVARRVSFRIREVKVIQRRSLFPFPQARYFLLKLLKKPFCLQFLLVLFHFLFYLL